jgi:hypothetical protein
VSRNSPSLLPLFRSIAADLRREEERRQRMFRDQDRAIARSQRAARHRYHESRRQKTADLNAQVEATLQYLRSIHRHVEPLVPGALFAKLRSRQAFPDFEPPPDLARAPDPLAPEVFLDCVRRPSWLVRWIPSVRRRHTEALQQAHHEYAAALARHEEKERHRLQLLAEARQEDRKSVV